MPASLREWYHDFTHACLMPNCCQNHCLLLVHPYHLWQSTCAAASNAAETAHTPVLAVCIHVLTNTIPKIVILAVLYDGVMLQWISFDELDVHSYQQQIW
jgi:hypothetical protein